MNAEHSKIIVSNEDFLSRIDAIRMSEVQRIAAKARFARAETIAAMIAAASRAIARLFGAVVRVSAARRTTA